MEPRRDGTDAAIQEEFLAAYDVYADALFRHCMIRIRDRELAKEIIQETFARTWLYLSDRKKVGHMRAFLYRVAHNLIIDTVRKRREVSLDKMQEDEGFEPADERAEDVTVKPEAREALKYLNGLDEIYRTVITMRFLDEMTPKEIAHALGVSENVVSVRIHRGVERLTKLMKAETV